MQYVGKVGDYVYNQWNSLNPATLSGAIDIIVIEQPDGTLHCSPWHVRFGKFQIIKPSQKKIDLYVNDIKTDLPMKLGEGGEAFFVFATDASDLSSSVVTSPVISAESSPYGSPRSSPPGSPGASSTDLHKSEPEALDLNASNDIESKIGLDKSTPPPKNVPSRSDTPSSISRMAFEKAKKITKKLNIPSKIDINGDMVLDMDGYKPNSQKNIDESDELVQKVFLREMNNLLHGKEYPISDEVDGNDFGLLQGVVCKDEDGKIRIINKEGDEAAESDLMNADNLSMSSEEPTPAPLSHTPSSLIDHKESDQTYFKTLRLTSEQLRSMKLNYGQNKLRFKLNQGNSQVVSDLYFWKATTPIVISDIDGTITKSDALGHVLNMIGRDWTHPGVAKLFQDIARNGYNIVYLTARSVGQADTTRQYLDSINQDGVKLPKGPVILSPDRTMAALRREIILKKPEVFKMACLRDISSLYFYQSGETQAADDTDERTPFYAGFGNRITDAISYRSVRIPSHRIFTINPYGEVHMELLELAGYRSSYLHIGELVDQFFPPLKLISEVSPFWNEDQFNQYIHSKDQMEAPNSPGSPRSLSSYPEMVKPDEKFTDLNYWREPLTNLSDFSDLEDDEAEPTSLKSTPNSPKLGSVPAPGSPDLYSVRSLDFEKGNTEAASPKKERPVSASFTSPLKNFMMFSSGDKSETKKVEEEDDDDFTDDDYDDDYTDDYDDDEDEDDDDEDDDEFVDGEDEDEDGDDYNDKDEEDDVDDEDIDLDDGLTHPSLASSLKPHPEKLNTSKQAQKTDKDVNITTARKMLKQLNLTSDEQKQSK